MYVATTFRVGLRHVEVDGLVDGGNTFASCINRATFDKLPFPLDQLVPTATSSVNQAGGGARLKVLGKLPDKNPDDGFFGVNAGLILTRKCRPRRFHEKKVLRAVWKI